MTRYAKKNPSRRRLSGDERVARVRSHDSHVA